MTNDHRIWKYRRAKDGALDSKLFEHLDHVPEDEGWCDRHEVPEHVGPELASGLDDDGEAADAPPAARKNRR